MNTFLSTHFYLIRCIRIFSVTDNQNYVIDFQDDYDLCSISSDDDLLKSNMDVLMLVDREEQNQQAFLIKMIDFIHRAQLNKINTNNFLSLLHSTKSLATLDTPKTINKLWEFLNVRFNFDMFYFCSTCFTKLKAFQDICSSCMLKQHANSELCIFSLGNELERVVQSTFDLMEWYKLNKTHIPSDIINSN